MLRYLRAMLIFARFQAWVDGVEWKREDAEVLQQFLTSPTGAKLRRVLLNMTLQQQARALSRTEGLQYEAGYCNGQRGLMAAIDSLADLKQFPSEESVDTDPHSIQ